MLSALLAALLTTAAPLRADDSPKEFHIAERSDAKGVVLSVESACNTEFTLTVKCELRNATSTQKFPLTVDAAGRQSFDLVRIDQKTPGQPWSYKYTYHWIPGARRAVQTNDAIYLLPFRAGEAHKVLQGNFGKFSHYQGSQCEYAVDFEAPVGTTVCAARAGVVTGLRQDFTVGGVDPALKSAANYLIVKHADGTFAEYLHLDTNGALVRLGEKVAEGQPIAHSGNTGYTQGPHLHFIVFQAIDGNTRLSLPTKYRTKFGIAGKLMEGGTY
jgi:murein DD-endopeptidase MepM/ murein hydrolase activator NlpD